MIDGTIKLNNGVGNRVGVDDWQESSTITSRIKKEET
jgi:hypothetical protein